MCHRSALVYLLQQLGTQALRGWWKLHNSFGVCPITLYCFHGVTASGHFSKRHTHLYHHRLASA